MDDKTEVVIFHDLAEVVVDNTKVLIWVGTQTFTIRHLDDDEAREINARNSRNSRNSTNAEKHSKQTLDGDDEQFFRDNDSGSSITNDADGAIATATPAPEDEQVITYDDDTNSEGLDSLKYHQGNLIRLGRTLKHKKSNGFVNRRDNNNKIDQQVDLIDIDDDEDDDDYEDISASDTLMSFSSNSSNDGTENGALRNINHKTKRTCLAKIVDTISKKTECPKTLCTICNKKFTSEYGKKRHQLSHFGIRPYQCPVCSKYFAQSSGYYMHKCTSLNAARAASATRNIKSKKSMLQCNACGKSFPGIYKLKRHEISHTGEKPYRCEVCQRAFTQWTGMNRHNCPGRVVDGEKIPPACEECGKIFKNDKYLKIHRQIHKFDGRNDIDDAVINDAVISADLDMDTSMDFIREMFC